MNPVYSLQASPFGSILMVGNAVGVQFLSLHPTPLEAMVLLAQEYPGRPVPHAPQELAGWMDAVQAYLAGQTRALLIPRDAGGTPFQQRVWSHLRQIPYGQTRTYAEVAQALGLPRGVRAVARACATNPVSLIVPCHRVIRGDGTLAGYRWGLETKRQLLQWERQQLLQAG